ncbi:MAG: hypothetical protein M3Y87_05965 [Myxococcota bacterium]|nr:hypothetical protein [Myxococcota bacterium]
MRTGAWIGVLVLAAGSASCALSHERAGASTGEPCIEDGECGAGVCGGLGGLGAGRCTTFCAGDFDCTGGWRCATERPDPLCDCTPATERCNGGDDDCDGAIDEGGEALCEMGLSCVAGACRCTDTTPRDTDDLDLLLMVDNSNSMSEEQASLAAALPRLVQMLASGDSDGDGEVDFDPIESLHIGVVTSDMGVGGHAVPTCDGARFGAMFGDDGVMITRGRTGIAGCVATYPAIFEFRRGDDPVAFAADVSCVAQVGTGGCGFEQQLEAVLKALSPSTPTEWTRAGYVPPVFFGSTSGHGDRANAGFVRADSVLAVVLLTDEEDCSVTNPDLFDPGSDTFSGTDLNLRCFTYPEATHPVERYTTGIEGHGGLLGLRRDPRRLVFGLIAGIPVDALPASGAADYDAILAHPNMMESIDPSMTTRLRPSCNVPGRGVAFAPRRMVRVAQQLDQAGAHVALGSICDASLGSVTRALIDAVAEPLTAPRCE